MAKVTALREETQDSSAVKQYPEAGYISGRTADSDSNLHIKDFFFKVYCRLETHNISLQCLAIAVAPSLIAVRTVRNRELKGQQLSLEVVLT